MRGREPRLSDLRESGALEQDSDMVMFLWREKERGEEDHDQDGEIIHLGSPSIATVRPAE